MQRKDELKISSQFLMQQPCERLPVELWHQIIRDALKNPSLLDIDERLQNQVSYERKLRLQDVDARRQVQQDLEITRRCLRSVCRSWQDFTDLTFEGLLEMTGTAGRTSLQSAKAVAAFHIDYSIIQVPSSTKRRDTPKGTLKETGSEERPKHRAQILTLNSPLSSIDAFLQHHGHLFPTLQVLDLRPASTFLTPKGGVSAGPTFFPTLSTLFPSLSSLLVDLPASSTQDILAFPHLRRLSYNIVGQSRLSDWQRGARIAEWSLPMIEHVSLSPVGCSKDWDMLLPALRVWGGMLKSLCWRAEFPDALGITIGAKDWLVCSELQELLYEGVAVFREKGTQSTSAITGTVVDTPTWHPFYKFPIPKDQVSSGR